MENQDNPFLIKKKAQAAQEQPKTVYSASDFDDLSPIKKKVVSDPGSKSGGAITSSPVSSKSNGLSWANQPTKSIDVSQEEFTPKPEEIAPSFQPTLGKTINTNTPNLQNNGGFMQDIAGNLSGERFSPIQANLSEKLTKINQAYDTVNPESTTELSRTVTKSPGNFVTGSPAMEDREGNMAKYFYNNFLNGIGRLATAVGDIGAVAMAGSPNVGYSYNDNGQPAQRTPQQMEQQRQGLKDYRANTAPVVRNFLKETIGADVDKGLEAQYDNETITSAIGGLFSSMPAMLMPAPVRGAAMILQGYDFGMQSVNESDVNGEVDDLTKTIYAAGIGTVNGLLEKAGFDRIMGSATAQAAKKITDKAIAQAVKETGGKVTGDVLTKFLNSNVREMATSFSKIGVKAFDGFVTEFATGSAQEVATIASEFLLNKGTGKPIFDVTDPTSMDGFLSTLKRVSYAGLQEGIGGFVMGGVLGGNRTQKALDDYNNKLDQINDELENPDLSPASKEVLVQKKIELSSEIEATQVNQEAIVQKLSPEELTTVNQLNEQVAKLTEVISDPNLSAEVRAEIEAQIPELQKQADQIFDSKDKSEASLSDVVERSSETLTVLADQLAEATSPAEVAVIKSQVEEAGKAGIDASQALNNVTEVKAETPATEVTNPSYETGSPISFQNESGESVQGIIKEVKGNKAIVGLNNDGIYAEQEIDLPAVEPAVTTEEKVVAEQETQATPVIETVAPSIIDVTGKAPIDLDAKKKKPKKVNENTRTAKQVARKPASFSDAVNQFFLSGNKLSTENFIAHTGFGFIKEANGRKTKLTPSETEEYLKNGKLQSGETVKMSEELRKAKFQGKVADRSKGGIDADQILQFHVPAEFSGEQGMDGVSEITNAAANVSKSTMLNEMEVSDQSGNEQAEDGNFGYTEAEIAELQAWEEAQGILVETYTDADVVVFEQSPELVTAITQETVNLGLTGDQINEMSDLVDLYTNENGDIDWKALEAAYIEEQKGFNPEFLTNDDALQLIFEYGSEKAKNQLNERAKGKVAGTKSANVESGKNESGGTSRSEVKTGKQQTSEKITKAKAKVETAKTKVSSLQAEVTKILDKLSRNLKENQADMFGQNKAQSMFDDKADQQKIVTDKQAELQEAYNDLAKANNDLKTAQETEGQIDLTLPDAIVEIDGQETDLSKTDENADAKIIVQSSLNPLNLISAIQKGVDKFENSTTTAIMDKIGDATAEVLKSWRTSKNTGKQWASSLATSVFGGIARTNTDANVKLGLIGGKNMAVHNMGKIMKTLYGLIDSNIESLERVHVVLDPDFYQKAMGGQSKISPIKNNFKPSSRVEAEQVYDANPELSAIGTKQEYVAHLESIFPNTASSEVLYHGTFTDDIQQFKGDEIYFTDDKNYAENVGNVKRTTVMKVLVDLKNPLKSSIPISNIPDQFAKAQYDSGQALSPKYIKGSTNFDGVIGKDAGQTTGNTIVVFDPKQVHILGGDVDKTSFGKYVSGKANGNSNAFNPNVSPNLKYDDLTDQEKMLFDEVRKNLDEIHFRNFALGFITKDTFDKHKGTYVPRMYETFELPTEVQEALDTYQSQTGDKLDLGAFKKRKADEDLSDAAKNAIIRDPVYLMAKRMMELDTNSAIMNYINHINRNNKSLVYEGDKPPVNYFKLEGKAYGALQGKYVPSYVAEDLKGYFFVNANLNKMYDIAKWYDRTLWRQAIKKGLTVYNPFVQLGNFTSNIVFAQLGGIDFNRWFGGQINAYKALQEKGTRYEELLSAGLIGTDIVTSDLMPNSENAQSILLEAQAKKNAGVVNKALKPLKAVDDRLMKMYAGNDDMAKINAYLIFLEQGYSEKESQKKVYDAFQNYATVGKFWDVAAKTPIFGNPFVKFPADLMRLTTNAVAKKPLSTSLYLAGMMLLPELLKQLGVSEDEDELEEELRTNRPFVPKMDIGVMNVPLVYRTKYGEINIARYITPFFFFDNGENSFLNPMIDKFVPFKMMSADGISKNNSIALPFGQDPAAGTLWNIMMDRDFRGKSIQDPEGTWYRASGITDGQRWQNKATHALRTWIPNGALMHDTYLNAKYGEDFYERTRTTSQALVNFAIKIQAFEDEDYKKIAEKQVMSLVRTLENDAMIEKNAYKTMGADAAEAQRKFGKGDISQSDYKNQIDRGTSELNKKLESIAIRRKETDVKLGEFVKKYERFLKR